MTERKIKAVNNNKEKYQTYAKLTGRYKAALRYKFYYEGLLIDYALIEDRLRSYLYYIGILKNRNATRVNQKVKEDLLPIIQEYKNEKENDTFSINTISGKIKIVRSIIRWSTETTENYSDNAYLKALKSACEGTDIGMLLELFEEIDEWRDYRNEIVHGLMNKNLESLYEDLEKRVIDGKRYSEVLDNQLRYIKKGNAIRKVLGLQNN